jgi:uncharacterized tellurite resistance protein B-like protein
MLDKCGSLREEPSQVVQDATKEEASLEQAHNIDDLPLSPMIAFGAAMMHVAASDNELAKEENEYIHKACFNDNKILGAACEYYKKYSYDELLEIFPELDRQQALCIMANLIDLAMADGVLHSEQQKMVWKFAKAAGLSNSDYEEFREFLLVKNQVTVLGV